MTRVVLHVQQSFSCDAVAEYGIGLISVMTRECHGQCVNPMILAKYFNHIDYVVTLFRLVPPMQTYPAGPRTQAILESFPEPQLQRQSMARALGVEDLTTFLGHESFDL